MDYEQKHKEALEKARKELNKFRTEFPNRI